MLIGLLALMFALIVWKLTGDWADWFALFVPGAILVVGLVIILRGKCDGYVSGAARCDGVSAIAVDRSRIVVCCT
jgi:fumarate reductase subunit D